MINCSVTKDASDDEFRKAAKLSILLSDDPLIQCIRDGIDSDVFIYRKGDLVWGKGDPAPSVELSANAFVDTLAKAKELGIWPRKPKEPATTGTGGEATGGGRGGDTGPSGSGGTTEGRTGSGTTVVTGGAVTAEGPLSQALIILFEKARTNKIQALSELRIKLFEVKATWSVHQAVATYRGADIKCSFSTSLTADGIDSFEVEFRGSIAKANAVKSFLEAQLRMADEHSFEGLYSLRFESPLATVQETAEVFIKAMTKYGGGEAYVEANGAADKEG